MKKVITGIELHQIMKEAIDLLCNTVKQTLGPQGNNVIIDHSDFSPFITNDGVTIAQNIESEQAGIATILELAKEASIKTNEMVGDGTTTTLVLLQILLEESFWYIEQGMSPILLKKELDQTLQKILQFLFLMKRKPNKKMLKSIAMISANDEEIGSLVYQAFQTVKNKDAIVLQEGKNYQTSLSHLRGYSFSIRFASPYFFKNQNRIFYTNALLVMVRGQIHHIEDISSLINQVMEYNQNLILIAQQFDEYFVQEILSLVLEEKLNCCLLNLEEYGLHEQMIFHDLEIISNGKVIENILDLTEEDIGHLSHIEINSKEARIDFLENKKMTRYVANLKKKMNEIEDDFQKSFYQKRIAMFTHGIITISIGAPTKIECREKRMRFEDAIWAISTSSHGVVPGAGICFLSFGSQLSKESVGDIIWKKALSKPFEQILLNAGCDVDSILSHISEQNFQILYNVSSGQFESCSDTQVIDSYEVVVHSLLHACSIASMLLTTTSLVINERTNLLKQGSEYNDF